MSTIASSRPAAITSLALALTLGLAACASKDGSTSKGASAGVAAAIGCAGGALVAKALGEKAAAGCVVGAVAGGLAGYQKARLDELKRAREAAAAMPVPAGASPPVVETQAVAVTDKATGKTETVEAFKALSMDVPVSQLQTRDGQDVMRKLGDYARKVADDRAESVNLDVARTASTTPSAKPDAPPRIVLESQSERVGKGTLVKRRLTDAAVPVQVQRVTVEATNAPTMTL